MSENCQSAKDVVLSRWIKGCISRGKQFGDSQELKLEMWLSVTNGIRALFSNTKDHVKFKSFMKSLIYLFGIKIPVLKKEIVEMIIACFSFHSVLCLHLSLTKQRSGNAMSEGLFPGLNSGSHCWRVTERMWALRASTVLMELRRMSKNLELLRNFSR